MRTGAAGTLTGVATAALLAAGVVTAPPALAATGDITTLAGGAGTGPALDLGQFVAGVALTPSRVWVLDYRALPRQVVLRVIDRATGLESFPLLGVAAPFANNPFPSIAAESNGNVLLAYNDDRGGIVAEVTPSGQTRVLAGGGRAALEHVDGLTATAERLDVLHGIAVTDNGVIYLSENTYSTGLSPTVVDSRIRKIGTGGKLTTVAGLGPVGFSGDGGRGVLAQLDTPRGLAVDPAGNLYIADSGNQRVRELSAALVGTISTVATGTTWSVAYDQGGLVIADKGTCLLRRLVGSSLTTVAGNRTCGWSGDGGPALSAAIRPGWLAALDGTIAFVQDDYFPLRAIDPSGTIRLLAGTGDDPHGGDGGPALNSQFASTYTSFIAQTALDPASNVYVTDGPRLRRISATGTITTVAGSVRTSYSTGAGGPATQATFRILTDVAVAPDGDVYLADTTEGRIYRIDGSGTLVAVAGGGSVNNSPDGIPATEARLDGAQGLAFDATGALVFADRCRIRRVEASGVLTTLAGQVSCGSTPDGAPAAQGAFGSMEDLALEATGSIVFADSEIVQGAFTERVRRIGLDGVVTTVAGGGTSTADGVPATDAQLSEFMITLAFDPLGRVLVADKQEGRVRRIDSDGRIRTVAGGGNGPDGGPAIGARLLSPAAIAYDAAGNLYIACVDTRTPYGGGAIRKVTQP
jgi:sugar lactone lactonase YvrE